MITENKIRIFEKYHGSIGAFEHAKHHHLKILSSSEFNAIVNFIEDIKLIRRGIVSSDYKIQVLEQIKNMCANGKIVDRLLQIADAELQKNENL